MIIYPAIDLKKGQCVRLFKGDMSMATIFNNSPSAQALEFESSGFKYLHLVDLDGAIEGKSVNEVAIKSILSSIKIPVQLGGGIRSLAAIENWLALGISRVILGTVAAKNPQLLIEAAKKFPGKIIVGIDANKGFVASEGWVEETQIKVLDLAKKYEDCGVASIIYTDIGRDGTLTGPDLEGTKTLAKNLTIPVIASGGISSIKDVDEVTKLQEDGVSGVIIGRALYEKKIVLEELTKYL